MFFEELRNRCFPFCNPPAQMFALFLTVNLNEIRYATVFTANNFSAASAVREKMEFPLQFFQPV